MLKRLVSLVLALVLLVSVCGVIPVTEAEAAYAKSTSPRDILTGLDSLRKKFPDGKYWNRMGKSKINYDGWTNNPCPDGHYLNGKQQCIGQCDGFARKLGTDLFGKSSYKWNSVKFNMDTLCVGDIIRYGNRHTIFVVGFAPKEDGGLIIADCNWDYHCGISWDRYFDISGRTVNWVLHYPGNNFTREKYLNMPIDSIKTEYKDYVAPMGRWVFINHTLTPNLPGDRPVTYTSDNPDVAEVNMYGCIQPKSPGTAKITLECGGAKTTCKVTITDYIGIQRMYGSNRINTAIDISYRFLYGEGKVENVILANGFEFADALAGVPLSKALNAPILLTAGKKLEDSVKNQLSELGAKNIYILGGNAAVSADIQTALEKNYSVKRLYGSSRYETAVVIAQELEALCGPATELFVANGNSFADALSAGPVAAAGHSPILYVRSTGEVDPDTGNYIASCVNRNVVILGGTGAVSDDIRDNLANYAVDEIDRVSGKNRYVTCIEIIRKYSDRFEDYGTISLATGKAFPDALAGGAFAANIGSPLLLTDSNISDAAKEWLSGQNVGYIYVFGGSAAVSDRTVYQYTV